MFIIMINSFQFYIFLIFDHRFWVKKWPETQDYNPRFYPKILGFAFTPIFSWANITNPRLVATLLLIWMSWVRDPRWAEIFCISRAGALAWI